MPNKRMITVLAQQIIGALLIALNAKLGLGIDTATITAIAASMGVGVAGYLWSQASTDKVEAKDA